MKKFIAVAAGLAVAGLVATAASAAPLGNMGTNAPSVDTGSVQLIHDGNRHRACELGQRGWHYHNGRGDRIDCRPRRPGLLYWTWRTEGGRSGWYHTREHRWH